MRENIIKLINSGIAPLRVSKATGIPQNTCYRIFNGEASLDNITLKNAELLNKFYGEMGKMFKIENIKRVSNGVLEYTLDNGDKLVLLDTEIREMEETHETQSFESVDEKQYIAVLSDAEYSDDVVEIIGFELDF